MKTKLIIIPLAAVFLSACIIVDGDHVSDSYGKRTDWQELEKDNRSKISALDIGDSVQSVLARMGVPEFDELLTVDDKNYRVLYYRTQRNESDGVTTKDECTPVVFVDGELTGFGQLALDSL